MSLSAADQQECWPALPLDSWKDTYATLHMWTQIVGKVRLCLTPVVNHWWNVPLYVTARGLTTSRIAYGDRAFEIWFDFIRHQLVLETSDGLMKTLALEPRSVAEFYQEFMELLRSAQIELKIWRMPVEIPDPIAFDQDRMHASYDGASVEKFWRILLSVDTVFNLFRARFIGKSSPVHFFWGSFDLAVTRFSGRRAPERPGADPITSESLFPRSQQCWLLARQRQRPRCGVLLIHGSRTPGIQREACSSGCRLLRPAARRVHPNVRRCAEGEIAHGLITRVLPKHVRSRGNAWQLGPQCDRKITSLRGCP